MLKKVLIFSGIVLVSHFATAVPLFYNGFETDTTGWENPNRVASGTGGIPSSSGGFHATAVAPDPFGGAGLTRWGGYNYGAGNNVATVFQEYTTSIDIYLNVGGGWANNTRFDFSSAISSSSGSFLRDFIFNAGYYNDATGPGANTSRFVISASNNSQPGSAFAKNPAFNPIAISTTGWYTFESHFYNNGGVLGVQMGIFDSSHALVNQWALGGDPIATVGGNRYGWFDFNEFSTLAFDNSQLSLASASVPESGATLAMLGIAFTALVGFRRMKKATVQ